MDKYKDGYVYEMSDKSGITVNENERVSSIVTRIISNAVYFFEVFVRFFRIFARPQPGLIWARKTR